MANSRDIPAVADGSSVQAGAVSAAQMRWVLDVSRMLAVTADLDPLLDHIATAVTKLLDCERASIFLHDPATDELWTKSALGLAAREIRILARTGIAGATFAGCQTLHVPRPYEDDRFNQAVDRQTGFVTRNILSTPMIDLNGQAVGVVQAINRRGPEEGFNDGDGALLQLLAHQAGVALQRYELQRKAMESVAMRREFDLAAQVQAAMIPAAPPTVADLEAAGWIKPANINGGDAYDLWRLPDGRLAVLVADASGHGMAPALVVLQARTLIRALSETEPDPLKLLCRVNARLVADMVSGRFVTAFLGFIGSDGNLDWASAAHGPVLLRERPDASIRSLQPALPPLGVVDLEAEAVRPVRIEQGGSLVVTSDGITEAFSPQETLFEESRLVGVLDACERRPGGARPDDIVAAIRDAVVAWQGGSDQPRDDQTIVAIKRRA